MAKQKAARDRTERPLRDAQALSWKTTGTAEASPASNMPSAERAHILTNQTEGPSEP
jgi:hypothetical protein